MAVGDGDESGFLRARQLLLRQLLVGTDGVNAESQLSLTDDVADELLDFCEQKRIVPLLARAIESDLIRCSSEIEASIVSAMRQAVSSRIRCEAALLELADVFDGEGVDFRVLKGLATGSLDYDEPVLRQVGDADVLIPTDRRREVFGLLQQQTGMELAFDTRRWSDELEHAFTFRLGGIELDIHHRLLRRAPGHMVAGFDLFTDAQPFQLRGRDLLALPDRFRLLHAAGHLVTSAGPMRRWSSHADVLRLTTSFEVPEYQGHAGQLVSLGVDAARAAAGLPVSGVRARTRIAWAYDRDERAPFREHLLELVSAPPLWSVKNQFSWLFGSGELPIARARTVGSRKASGPRADATNPGA